VPTLPTTTLVVGETVILVVHQAIYVPHMQHSLLSTMQLRLNDIFVNKCPKFLTNKPTNLTHFLITIRGMTNDPDSTLLIPPTINGVTSTFLTSCKSCVQEYETCLQYELMFDSPDYNPHNPTYSRQEDAVIKTLSETWWDWV
jgi:hypothetical protein